MSVAESIAPARWHETCSISRRMARYSPLTATDRFFLSVEDRTAHMHVSGTCIVDAGPLDTGAGGIDMDRIRTYVEARLDRIPRYRQRLSRVPIGNAMLWVDDHRFNPAYHVRHVSVPRPGSERQLKRLVAWINSQQLDRKKPLWEMWVIEGLEGGRFALVNKVHHCMVDGVAGADLMSVLLSPDPDEEPGQRAAWFPESPPELASLLSDALQRGVDLPLQLGKELWSTLKLGPNEQWRRVSSAASGLAEVAKSAVRAASPTPLNARIGSHRRFDWVSLDLDDVKTVKNRLGGTINDVVLATVTGATRSFLAKRGFPDMLEKNSLFRVLCPVSTRPAGRHAVMGNRVAGMLVDLPVHEQHARQRFGTVRENARLRKDSFQAEAIELIELVGEWMAPSVLLYLERFAARNLLYNMIVTNVPGPQTALYMLGARVTDLYPQVPLFENQGLGVALFSYDGRLCWGFNADRDLIPDLHAFVESVEQSFQELLQEARAESG